MHWAYEIAEDLIQKYPDRKTFVCASGISPSGSVHIGNFREIVTTFFVVKALRNLGKQTRFILSWDDYDRFRKVPGNIDPSFEKYIGMPYADIPDPYGCHASYAEHFEKELEASAGAFGIDAEFIYQSKEYRSGRYNEHILQALKHRKTIYDIVTQFKTNDGSEEERGAFYPITVYCESCEKDDTEVQGFDEQSGTLEYACRCGHRDTLKVMKATNVKLNWKVDWPMRWMVEGVVFEPGGRDHSSETGSYNVSKKIAQTIFHYKEPEYVAYDFIGLKGGHGKMSSSSGNGITPGELLKVYLPEIILFMFAKYQPGSAFTIGLDEDVVKNYTEYERYRANDLSGSLQDETIRRSLKLAEINRETDDFPKFNQVAGVLPLVNFDVELLRDVLSKMGENYSLSDLAEISSRATYWIQHYQPQKIIRVNDNKDVTFYRTLDEVEKIWLQRLCGIIRESEQLSQEQLMSDIYDICRVEDKKVMKASQKRLFQMVYKLVLDSRSGPRLPLLIQAVGQNKMLFLLDFQ